MPQQPLDPSLDDEPTQPNPAFWQQPPPPNEFSTQPYYPPQPAADEFSTQPYYPQQPLQPVEQYQQVRLPQQQYPQKPQRAKSRGNCFTGCLQIGCLGVGLLLAVLALYLLAPVRSNILVLGIDRTPDGTAVGRSDTMILVSVVPLQPTVNLLSIPRDLWVNVPGVGEQRINTAHFFAEANETGTGPQGAVEAVEANFDVQVPYYVRIRFDSFARVVDALGGVTVNLPEDMSGLSAGEHHLSSEQALAFVRDRKGSDDFFRMSRGQILIRGVLQQMLQPATWQRLPEVLAVASQSIDTNIPLWQMPRLGLAVVRAGPHGINSQSIDREMVTPYTTDGGANVLLPNWDKIRPLVKELFQQ